MDFKIRPLKKLVKWMIRKFFYDELLYIFSYLFKVLIFEKDKHKFKQKLPKQYRNFKPCELAPLVIDKPDYPHYTSILSVKNIKPVKSKDPVPENISCPYCKAPSRYLYFNNGKKRSQIKCKCCNKTFSSKIPKITSKKDFYCPHCNRKLHRWKTRDHYISYKCSYDDCKFYLKFLNSLDPIGKLLYEQDPSNFKSRYNYKHYFIDYTSLSIAKAFDHNIKNIHNPDLVGKIFTFRFTYGLSLRNTVKAIFDFFGVHISHQTILNYQNMYAYLFQKINSKYSKLNSCIASADETYIKILSKQFYIYYAIDCFNKNIFADHISDNREFHSVCAFFNDVCKNSNINVFDFITDGLPTYQEVLNQAKVDDQLFNINHVKVIGLQNLDKTSEEYRAFKQIIERFNETFKGFYKIQRSFKSYDGAVNYNAAFIVNYNFIRPHSSLNGRTPVQPYFLQGIDKSPDKWVAILHKALTLN